MMAGVEASLGFILTLIFLKVFLTFYIKGRQSLKTEEIVCLIIMLAL